MVLDHGRSKRLRQPLKRQIEEEVRSLMMSTKKGRAGQKRRSAGRKSHKEKGLRAALTLSHTLSHTLTHSHTLLHSLTLSPSLHLSLTHSLAHSCIDDGGMDPCHNESQDEFSASNRVPSVRQRGGGRSETSEGAWSKTAEGNKHAEEQTTSPVEPHIDQEGEGNQETGKPQHNAMQTQGETGFKPG